MFALLASLLFRLREILDAVAGVCPHGRSRQPLALPSQGSPRATRMRAEIFPRGLDSPKSRQLRLNIFEAAEIGLAAILN
jgi:hypothetical protein